jgi:hypothetical protein
MFLRVSNMEKYEEFFFAFLKSLKSEVGSGVDLHKNDTDPHHCFEPCALRSSPIGYGAP